MFYGRLASSAVLCFFFTLLSSERHPLPSHLFVSTFSLLCLTGRATTYQNETCAVSTYFSLQAILGLLRREVNKLMNNLNPDSAHRPQLAHVFAVPRDVRADIG